MVHIAPYRPTPPEVVNRMIELAEVRSGDVFYDLGCGDGRLVIAAAKRGAKAYGIDIDKERVRESQENVKHARVENAYIMLGDVFKTDFSKATVVSLYLVPPAHAMLKRRLKKLQPGSRIVCHDFEIDWWAKVTGFWKPEKEERLGYHKIFLYRV